MEKYTKAKKVKVKSSTLEEVEVIDMVRDCHIQEGSLLAETSHIDKKGQSSQRTEKEMTKSGERSRRSEKRSEASAERSWESAERSQGSEKRSVERSQRSEERSPMSTEMSTGSEKRSQRSAERSQRSEERSAERSQMSEVRLQKSPESSQRLEEISQKLDQRSSDRSQRSKKRAKSPERSQTSKKRLQRSKDRQGAESSNWRIKDWMNEEKEDGQEDSQKKDRLEETLEKDRRVDSLDYGQVVDTGEENGHRDVQAEDRQEDGQWDGCEDRWDPADGQDRWQECATNKERRTQDFPLDRFLAVDDGWLLVMKTEEEVCVVGMCTMTVLCGSVVVLGYECRPSHQPVQLFSAQSNSLLTINCTNVESDTEVVQSVYAEHRLATGVIERLPHSAVAVVMMARLQAPHCEFLTTLRPFQHLFGRSENYDGRVGEICMVSSTSRHPKLVINQDYYFVRGKWIEELANSLSPILLSCGGKDSGKSTLNRFLLNSTLNEVNEVCYLECDMAQTEFTPPGCLALHSVTVPVLGPPFSHQREPHFCCFFGGLTASDDPDRYLQCVRQCFHHYQQLEPRRPLVVNTMGWTTGVGLLLLVDILRIVQPDIVVQIDCRKEILNLPTMTPSNVAKEPSWTRCLDWRKKEVPQKDHGLVILESVVTQARGGNQQKLRPGDHRDLSLLSYLGQGLNALIAEPQDLAPSPLTTQPYIIDWTTVAIHVCHDQVPPSQILEAINACVVALCCLDGTQQRHKDDEESPWLLDKMPVCTCVGYGFVRGIDRQTKSLYIVSPLPLSKLSHVNLLMRGSVNLPEQLLKMSSSRDVPYVDSTASAIGASALRQRRHMPRRPDQGIL